MNNRTSFVASLLNMPREGKYCFYCSKVQGLAVSGLLVLVVMSIFGTGVRPLQSDATKSSSRHVQQSDMAALGKQNSVMKKKHLSTDFEVDIDFSILVKDGSSSSSLQAPITRESSILSGTSSFYGKVDVNS